MMQPNLSRFDTNLDCLQIPTEESRIVELYGKPWVCDGVRYRFAGSRERGVCLQKWEFGKWVTLERFIHAAVVGLRVNGVVPARKATP